MSEHIIDILIVGGGPAGLSAALYARRAGLRTALITKDKGALATAGKIENYFGVSGTPSGGALVDTGLQQVRELGVEVIHGEVFNITFEEAFVVAASGGTYHARSVILATGTVRKSIRIKNLDVYEGQGVSWCAVCDAFFFRGKKVAVLGNAEYALHELSVVQSVASEAVLLTAGVKIPTGLKLPFGVKVYDQPIDSLYGEGKLEGVLFKNGEKLALDGIFMALGSAGAAELARKAGAMISGTAITVDADMATSIPGMYAAGDCTGGILQISVAVGEGAKAGLSAVKYVKSLSKD